MNNFDMLCFHFYSVLGFKKKFFLDFELFSSVLFSLQESVFSVVSVAVDR